MGAGEAGGFSGRLIYRCPPGIGREGWPTWLHPDLDRHGSDKVWSIGLEVLGFPPTWADRREETQLLSDTLAAMDAGVFDAV